MINYITFDKTWETNAILVFGILIKIMMISSYLHISHFILLNSISLLVSLILTLLFLFIFIIQNDLHNDIEIICKSNILRDVKIPFWHLLVNVIFFKFNTFPVTKTRGVFYRRFHSIKDVFSLAHAFSFPSTMYWTFCNSQKHDKWSYFWWL